jgi:uncharacterized protein YbjT (DUF2867 family)
LPQVRACVAGATGLVGRALLQRLAGDARIAHTVALVRAGPRAAVLPPALQAQAQALAVDYTALGRAGTDGLPRCDWAFCALGTTIKVAGSQAAFRAVDFDAVLAFARAAKVAGAGRLGVVSALGADVRSSVFYNRVKGEMEQALAGLGFDRLVVARPSLLLGERGALGQPTRSVESLVLRLMPAVGWLVPRKLRPISADAVAAALVEALGQDGPALQIIESDGLQALADTALR